MIGAPDPGREASPPPEEVTAAAATVPAGPEAGGSAEQAAARIAELEDQRLRALADAENVRKRCAGQVARAREEERAEVARQWLPVLDSLDLALRHAAADPASIIEGIKAVREQALGVLARFGFARREDLGASFDPARHEAVASRPDPDAPDGSVIEVVRPGYGDGNNQLRPAQVIVARAE